MVVLTLQDVKNPKRNTAVVVRKKTGSVDGPEKLLIYSLTGILLRGVGFLGSFLLCTCTLMRSKFSIKIHFSRDSRPRREANAL